jgi:hypothetical protein
MAAKKTTTCKTASQKEKEALLREEQCHKACLKFIEQRHRAGDGPSLLLYTFSWTLHQYSNSDIAEQIDNEREGYKTVKNFLGMGFNVGIKAKSAAAGGK